MDKVAVINASPLIFLSRGGHLNLLEHFAPKVLVPKPVAEEILEMGSGDCTAKALTATSWLKITPVPVVPDIIRAWGLGRGESAVLALAYLNQDKVAVIDDLAGRRCAAGLGIAVRGTLGIVLLAKKRCLIPSARAVMEDLIRAGLYLSRPVLETALARVGE